MAISKEHKLSLEEWQKEAAKKLAELPQRIEEEKAAAADADPPRKPFPIVPLQAVTTDALGAALAEIKSPGDLSETVKTWGKVCRNQSGEVAVRCDQLVAVLALAGIGQPTSNPV
jgi:hypothetical protein